MKLQLVLKGLRGAIRDNYNPEPFCRVFKFSDGTSINPYEQMDADEFFNSLMDRLEENLRKNDQHGAIKRTFGGKFIQEIISSDCEHRSISHSDFLTISLDVKNISNVLQSLGKHVTGELLEGENRYDCATCQKKVNALKRESIKALPNHLILVLKRFEFNFDNMTKIKLNSYCEFPEKLDMYKYTVEHLSDDADLKNKSSEYYNYTLRGVVIHRGTAESGHYFSLIKDSNGKWLEFNDHNIRDFNFDLMPTYAFGQDSDSDSIMDKAKNGMNAYMLLYEREKLFDAEGQPITKLLGDLGTVDSVKQGGAK
jgi:ubiquitin carboxyl-terminal hydrolase 9/24